MRRLVLTGCLAALLLAGCGQKGALYLPDKKGAVVTSAPATARARAGHAAAEEAQRPGRSGRKSVAAVTAPRARLRRA
jgi:predicted small lipoprotein YifL